MNDDEASRTYGNTFFNTGNSIFFNLKSSHYSDYHELLLQMQIFRVLCFWTHSKKTFQVCVCEVVTLYNEHRRNRWFCCLCADQFETSTNPPPLLLGQTQGIGPPEGRGGGGLYTRYHSRGFATGSERSGYAGYSNSEMEEFKIKEQLFEANGLFSKVYFSNSQSAKQFFFERGIQPLHWANVTTRVACDNVSSFGSCPHESGDF